MLRKNHRNHHGALRINTAQAIIFVIAIGCIGVVVNAYQKSQVDDTALAPPAAPPNKDPKYLRYASEIKKWQGALSPQQMTLTWPYNSLESAARLDLPDKVPVTLADWNDQSERLVAQKCYQDFVQVRVRAHVPDPTLCIVHVFAPSTEAGAPQGTMEEVAQASASGVAASGDASMSLGN